MKKITQIILLLTLCTGCAKTLYFPTYDENSVHFHTDSLGFRMIGIASVHPNDSLSQFRNNWYSKHLRRLGEPVIYNNTDQTQNTIRFTQLGTWSNPVSYRLEQKNGKIAITYNRTNGQGGYDPGVRVEHKTKTTGKEKWDLVLCKMDSIDFWNVGTHDKNMILDGTEWIFEAHIDGRYHFITRNSPDAYDGKDYAELCMLLVQIYNE